LRILAVLTLIIALSGEALHSQELSTSVFPSEDELYQAYSLGEITFEQLIRLQEIAFVGVDSTTPHLLDEIPNLSLLNLGLDTSGRSLESEQAALFSGSVPARTGIEQWLSGVLRHRYVRDLEEQSESKYQTSITLGFGDNLAADLRLQREYSGNERLVGRGLTYRSADGPVRDIRLGNFSRRLGLGTIVGYRGKLFDYSDQIDGESFLYPDYGGQNGLYSRLRAGVIEAQSMVSVQRDSEFRLVTKAVMFSHASGSFQLGLIVAGNSLVNRTTGKDITDYKTGIHWQYRYAGGYNRSELSLQAGERKGLAGAVTEGRHRFRPADVRYALWRYSDDYLNLSGGGKAASLSSRQMLDAVEFNYSCKRAGQTGGLFKSLVDLTSSLKLSNSFLYAAIDSDTADLQWLSGLMHTASGGWAVTLDHLRKTKRRVRDDRPNDSTSTRTRLELRTGQGLGRLRTYLAWNTRSRGKDFLTAFARFTREFAAYGRIELWGKVDRIEPSNFSPDYWYAYIKNEIYLLENVDLSIKLSHTYHGHYEDKHRTVVSLEMKVLL